MRDRLARLHNAHDGRLRLILPVRRDALVRLLILLGRLLQLDGVDLDAVPLVVEVEVHGECIRVVDVAAFRVFGQGAEFRACERLQGAFDFGFGEAGFGEDAAVGDVFVFADAVEKEEDDGLEGRYNDFFVASGELGAQLTVREGVLP